MGWFEGQKWRQTLPCERELNREELHQVDELFALLTQHHPHLNQEDVLLWKRNHSYTARKMQ